MEVAKDRTTKLEVTIEVKPVHLFGAEGAWASIKFGNHVIYEEYVYDNADTNPAEQNILNLFGDRLQKLLEDR